MIKTAPQNLVAAGEKLRAKIPDDAERRLH